MIKTMGKTRGNIIHYVNSSILNNSRINSVEIAKYKIKKKYSRDYLNKIEINNKNRKLAELEKNLSVNNEKRANIISYKNGTSNIKVNNISNNYNTTNSQKKNSNRSSRFANSFNKKKELKCCCCCCCCFLVEEPIKYNEKFNDSNIKMKIKEKTFAHQRFMTTENSLKKRKNQNIKMFKENKVSKNNIPKKNEPTKKFKTLTEIPSKKQNMNNKKNEIKNTNKNKYLLQTLKKFKKRKKYDLSTINDSNSKEERIRNLIYGISYLKEQKECELCYKMVNCHTYKFHYYSHPSKILNWMFLGDLKNASNIEEIKILGFKYILNCAAEIKQINIPDNIKYCHLDLTDSSLMNITQFFPKAFSFIESARKEKEKILIHCKLGISRSPSIIIGYLIKYMGYNTKSALNFLRTKRSQVYPNQGFISQLYSYEKNISSKIKNSSLKF